MSEEGFLVTVFLFFLGGMSDTNDLMVEKAKSHRFGWAERNIFEELGWFGGMPRADTECAGAKSGA